MELFHDDLWVINKDLEKYNYTFDYFSMRTMMNSYLIKEFSETPVQMFIRVSV